MAAITAAPARQRASPFLLTFIFTCQERDAAGARPVVHPSRLQRRLLSSSSLLVLLGKMLPLVYVTLSVSPLYTCTLLSPVYLSSKLFLHWPPPPPFLASCWCLLAYLCLVMMPLSLLSLAPQHAIDILPPSSLLLNDFLLPLASFPLSSFALHKSTQSLDPSKANDHHLFSSTPVSFFSFLPVAHFLLPLQAHTFCIACAHTRPTQEQMSNNWII